MGRQNKTTKQAKNNNEHNRFDAWYKSYESQCWYKNTFLVNEPKQIAKAEKSEEWNNIDNFGCNFTCLAMIIGINPAYLASKLGEGELKFFEKDSDLPATTLEGKEGGIVWDQNKPDKKGQILKISDVFLAPHSIVDVIVTFERRTYKDDIDKAIGLIERVHSQGEHIICGHSDHSRLVAGTKNGEYFLYDPDLDSTDLINNLHGEYTLEWFYKEYEKEENKEELYEKGAEYCIYSVVKKASKL